MNLLELRTAAETYLAPVMSARVLPDTEPCAAGANRVASLEPAKIAIKARDEDEERLVLFRNPGFSPAELQLAKDFAHELFQIHDATGAEYREELFTFLPARAIARNLGNMHAVRLVLTQFEVWAARTYEGGAITSSIGIDPNATGSGVTLSELFPHDFSAVLSNGFDTMLVANSRGELVGSGQLAIAQIGLDHAPYRLSSVADWCTGGRVALVLNRLGEQLVFSDKKLIFAKRRGEWQFYAHEMYIRQLQPPQNRELREAIYQSCLDISFARTGGCIVVARSGSIDEVDDLVADKDRLDKEADPSIKTRAIKAMVGQKFQGIDRRLRQEFLALDGATVVTHEGDILAIGAIISVPSGSDGGGRRAAALKGSNLGLGIKISEDGEISVFKNEELIFTA